MKQIIITLSVLVLPFCTPTSAQTLSSWPAGNANDTTIRLIPKPINYNPPPLDQLPHTREVITGSDDPDSVDAIRTIVPVVQVGNGTTYSGGATYGMAYAAGGSDLGNRLMVQHLISFTYYDKAWGNWGKWVGPLYCPEGQWAVGAQLRMEGLQFRNHWLKNFVGDDTAMNAFRLLCAKVGTFGVTHQTVEPHGGYWGDWHKAAYCERSLVVGFELRTERAEGHQKKRWAKMVRDRVAATGLRILCSNEKVIELDGSTWWGEWAGQVKCPKRSAVCGAFAQVESPQRGDKNDPGETDNTGLNNIIMDCCKFDPVSCTPTDKWEVVFQFKNEGAVEVAHEYSKTTGTTRTDSKEKSGSQEDQWKEDVMGEAGFTGKGTGLSARFSATLGTSGTTKTDWKEVSTSSFTKSVEEKLTYKVPPKSCVMMRQVVGTCGDNIVRTNKIQLASC